MSPLRRLDDAGKLVDVEPLQRARYDTGTELVPVPSDQCPQCDAPLFRSFQFQDSLVRHGGYGGTRRVEIAYCSACFFERIAAVGTERPPR